MSKILLLGYDPPPLKGNAKIEAAHYRTWQFLQPLLADGHIVCLCTRREEREALRPSIPEEWSGGLVYHSLAFDQVGWTRQLQRIHDAFEPDCIVAVNLDACLYSTKIRTDKPIWMDIYGDGLTIMQAACFRAQSDRGLTTSIVLLREVLRTGDRFSGCSETQGHALVGELAMAGRLNRHTFGYDFAQVILPGALPPVMMNTSGGGRTLLTHYGVSEDDFVVLWCGGYNTWTDVDTLFKALEWAMAQNARIHYVSVGASTYDAADNVYVRFQAMIEDSPYRTRFHLVGWRPWTEVASFCWESNVGLNIDALHYETIYGTRTRILEMMAAGLPVITSLGCELSYLLHERNAGLTFEIGDWQQLGRQIDELAGDQGKSEEMQTAAYRILEEELSFEATTAPVRRWVLNPQPAPDKISLGHQERLRQVEYQVRSMMRHLIWQVVGLAK